VIELFVNIGGIVDHHCFNILLLINQVIFFNVLFDVDMFVDMMTYIYIIYGKLSLIY
jgi:hypothetical protein